MVARDAPKRKGGRVLSAERTFACRGRAVGISTSARSSTVDAEEGPADQGRDWKVPSWFVCRHTPGTQMSPRPSCILQMSSRHSQTAQSNVWVLENRRANQKSVVCWEFEESVEFLLPERRWSCSGRIAFTTPVVRATTAGETTPIARLIGKNRGPAHLTSAAQTQFV